MTMDRTNRKDGADGISEEQLDAELERAFAAARQAPAPAPDALIGRVLSDALAVQEAAARTRGRAQAGTRAKTRAGPQRDGLFRALWTAIGGWPAGAGLAAACAAGIWIGFDPGLGLGEAVSQAFGAVSGESAIYGYLPDYGFGLADGDTG